MRRMIKSFVRRDKLMVHFRKVWNETTIGKTLRTGPEEGGGREVHMEGLTLTKIKTREEGNSVYSVCEIT